MMQKVFFACTEDITIQEYVNEYNNLGAGDKEKINNIKTAEGKKRSILGRMMARRGIAHTASLSSEDIEFCVDTMGKPYCSNADVYFSISHCRSRAVCVVCDDPVGVDIEHIKPVKRGFIERVCSDGEIGYILGDCSCTESVVTDMAVLERFFKVWTVKEAWFKMRGTGIKGIRSTNAVSLFDRSETFRCGEYAISIVVGTHDEQKNDI